MGSYRIEWKRSAVKDLKSLPKDVIPSILAIVTQLGLNPYPHGVKKLRAAEHTYRVRQGDYRVVYTISKASLTIEILRVAHRKEVYER